MTGKCDMFCATWYHLYNLKNTKTPMEEWRSVTFSNVSGLPAILLKLTLLHWCFSNFLNSTDGIKSRNAPHIQLAYTSSELTIETLEQSAKYVQS